MANIGLLLLFICFGIGIFYCAPIIIRDGLATLKEIKEMDEEVNNE